MDILYKNKTIEKQCTDLKEAKKLYGCYGENILGRINLLVAMKSFQDVCNYPGLNCHLLSGKLNGYWSIDVKGRKCSLRIILCPLNGDGEKVKIDDDFANECKLINIIFIEEVSNHYE